MRSKIASIQLDMAPVITITIMGIAVQATTNTLVGTYCSLDLPDDNVSTGIPSTVNQTSYWVGC